MKINEQLGMRISYLRKQRGLSQLDLSCEANINRNYLCDLEKGKRLSKSIKKYGIDDKFVGTNVYYTDNNPLQNQILKTLCQHIVIHIIH